MSNLDDIIQACIESHIDKGELPKGTKSLGGFVLMRGSSDGPVVYALLDNGVVLTITVDIIGSLQLPDQERPSDAVVH